MVNNNDNDSLLSLTSPSWVSFQRHCWVARASGGNLYVVVDRIAVALFTNILFYVVVEQTQTR